MSETRLSNLRGPLLVNDWQVVLGPHGVVVSRTPQSTPASTLRRAASVLPDPFPHLLGRVGEASAVFDGLRTESVTEVWGECGIGKTSVLRHVAHRATSEFPDWPIVYLSAAGQPIEDLLQEIHNCLFQSRNQTKLGAAAVRRELRRSPSILLLDDVALSTTDLADLLRSLPESRVVLTSAAPRCQACRSVELGGLDEPAAVELVRRGMGPHDLHDDELDYLPRLCGILYGHPLRLLQAAALVRAGRQSLPDLVRSLEHGDPAALLARECRSALSPDQRRLVAALALAAGAFLPTDLVEQMCTISDVVHKLRELSYRHVVDGRTDRFGLPVCSIGEPRELVRESLERGIALHGLVQWLQHPSTSPDDILSLSHSLLTLIEVAAEYGEWYSVLDIVRVVERILAMSGRWEQWRYAAEAGLHAAEQLNDDLQSAYHLHQLGSRALCLGFNDQAMQLLEEARSLRPPFSRARRVTVHNLRLVRPRGWPLARSAAMAAAAAATIAGGAGVVATARSQQPHNVVPAPSTSPSSGVLTPTPAGSPTRPPDRSPSPTHSSVSSPPSATARIVAVTRVTPVSGPQVGGTKVVISGSGFARTTDVSFGRTAATTFNVDADTQISAVSPPGNGTVDVTVTTPDGVSTTGGADLFTYVPVPVVACLNPATGSPAGGTRVVISGRAMTGATSVSFGKAAASSFTVDSDTRISAVSPPGDSTVAVRVTTSGGISATGRADLFTYLAVTDLPVPIVVGLDPAKGSAAGGTRVVISGRGFTGATNVCFGDNAASSFTVGSDTYISAVSPAGRPGTVDVTVTTPGGTSAPGQRDQFVYS